MNPGMSVHFAAGAISGFTSVMSKKREVLGLDSLKGNILCSPSLSEETINQGPNTPISTTHAWICEELKDPGTPPKVVL